jgi:hypothetical protein
VPARQPHLGRQTAHHRKGRLAARQRNRLQ